MRTIHRWTFMAGITGLLAVTHVGCSGDDTAGGTSSDGGAGDATAPDSGPLTDGAAHDGPSTGDAAADAPLDALPTAIHFVYVESNDVRPGMNSILAYAQAADGSLSPLTGSPFATGGTGVSNPTQGLGPDDSDQELILSPDGKRLFAVNAGSNTIAVFDVHTDGSLAAVTGSPFASGGINPVSVGLSGNFLFVVNQDGDPLQDAAAGMASYSTMTVAMNGALAAVAGSTVAAGKSPQLALPTPDGKLLFGVDFMAPLASAQGPLRAFAVSQTGTLTAAPGTPMAIPVVAGGMPPGTPLALGLALHPTQKILYVGFVLRKQIGVYTYDGTTGALTYVANAAVSGPAPCWVRVNTGGTRLYVTDTADNSVSVLDATNPLAPTEIQHLLLADPGPTYDAGGMAALTSESYEENLSPDGKFLFVVSQRTTTDPNVAEGNVLHVLSVATDGMLTESVADVKLPVPKEARPQGVVVR